MGRHSPVVHTGRPALWSCWREELADGRPRYAPCYAAWAAAGVAEPAAHAQSSRPAAAWMRHLVEGACPGAGRAAAAPQRLWEAARSLLAAGAAPGSCRSCPPLPPPSRLRAALAVRPAAARTACGCLVGALSQLPAQPTCSLLSPQLASPVLTEQIPPADPSQLHPVPKLHCTGEAAAGRRGTCQALREAAGQGLPLPGAAMPASPCSGLLVWPGCSCPAHGWGRAGGPRA